MPLSKLHQKLLDRSVQAAEKAGALIMDYYGRDVTIMSKDIDTHTGGVVTQADHEAEALILKELGDLETDPLLKDVAILAEEMDDHGSSQRFEKDYCFVIDPLDGTRGFLDRNNSFATSIGFIRRDGTPVFGVALLPGMGKTYIGIHGEQTHENGRLLTQPDLACGELVLYLSEAEIFPARRNRVWHLVCNEIKARTPIRKIRPQVIGSPVHKGCCTAASRIPALYLGLPRAEKGVSLWDMAAIAAITTGAGGHVSDCFGNPMALNREESTYVHHHGFLYTTHREIAEIVIEVLAKDSRSC